MLSLLTTYENIDDAGAPYESREGGYQISHDSAQDITAENIPQSSHSLGVKVREP